MELHSFNGIFKFCQVDIYINKSHSMDLIITTHNWATVHS